MTPDRWKTEYGERLRARRSPHYRGSLLPVPIALPGHIPLHTFVGRIAPIIRRERPDVILRVPRGLRDGDVSSISRQYPRWRAADRVLQRAEHRETLPVAIRSVGALRVPPRVVCDRAGSGARRMYCAGRATVSESRRSSSRSTSTGERPKGYRPWSRRGARGYPGRRRAHTRLRRETRPRKGRRHAPGRIGCPPRQQVRAMIAGTGAAAEGLRNHASELGITDQVSWLGYVPYAETPTVYPPVRRSRGALADGATLEGAVRARRDRNNALRRGRSGLRLRRGPAACDPRHRWRVGLLQRETHKRWPAGLKPFARHRKRWPSDDADHRPQVVDRLPYVFDVVVRQFAGGDRGRSEVRLARSGFGTTAGSPDRGVLSRAGVRERERPHAAGRSSATAPRPPSRTAGARR